MIATVTTVDKRQEAEKSKNVNLRGSELFAEKEIKHVDTNNDGEGDGDGDINIIFPLTEKIEASRFSRPKGTDTVESLVILFL